MAKLVHGFTEYPPCHGSQTLKSFVRFEWPVRSWDMSNTSYRAWSVRVCSVFWLTWIFVRQSKQGSEATSLHFRGTTCFKIRSKVCKTLQKLGICGWCDHTRSGWMNDGRRESNQCNRRAPLSLMHPTTELWLFNIGSDIKPITAQLSNLGIWWYQVHWPGSSSPGNYPSQHGTTVIPEVCVLNNPVDWVQYVWIAG